MGEVAKVQGDRAPKEQPIERTYSPGKGWHTTRKWNGEEKDILKMASMITSFYPNAVSVAVKPYPPGLAELVVGYDNISDGKEPEANEREEPQPDTENWSLDSNQVEKDIWSHSSIIALATDAPNDYNWLRTNLSIIMSKGTFKNVLDVWDDGTWDDSATTKELFEMFRDGVEAFTVDQYVLRRVRTVHTNAKGKISVDYVGYQFTLAELAEFEGFPSSGLRFATPTGGAWIKKAPSISFDPMTGKADCTQEFWWAESWVKILYPLRVEPSP